MDEHLLTSDRLRVGVIPLGATLCRVELDGIPVALALPGPDDYQDRARNPHLGASAGRYANRIDGAAFTLDGVEHHLDANDGPNTLHGGPQGFGHRMWTVLDGNPSRLRLRFNSPSGDQGFPGALTATATYSVHGELLGIDYEAESDAPTVVNLTNHSYWNLGQGIVSGDGSAQGQVLAVAAARYLPVDAAGIPTGSLAAVDGTPFDLRRPTLLGEVMGDVTGGGFDHCFDLGNDEGTMHSAAVLQHPATGRWLEVSTDQVGVQVYTANNLGPPFARHGAVCLETQRFPDAPNRPQFPSAVLRPGDRYRSRTEIRFGVGRAPSL